MITITHSAAYKNEQIAPKIVLIKMSAMAQFVIKYGYENKQKAITIE